MPVQRCTKDEELFGKDGKFWAFVIEASIAGIIAMILLVLLTVP